MRSTAPFNFINPLVDLARRGVASDAMQQWMRSLLDSIGGEYHS
jgi:hypothetical protein